MQDYLAQRLAISSMNKRTNKYSSVMAKNYQKTRYNPNKKLQNLIELHSGILDQVTEAIFIIDLEGKVAFWNKEAEDVFGYTGNEIVGKNVYRLCNKDVRNIARDYLNNLLNGGSKDVVKWEVSKKNGETTWAEIKIQSLKSAEGVSLGYIGAVKDITSQKRYEDNLKFNFNVSKKLAESLDYEATLKEIGNITVPYFADWYSVDLVDRKGNLKQVSIVHKDPNKVIWASKLRKKYPINRNSRSVLWRVIETGVPEFYPFVSDKLIKKVARDNDHLKVVKEIGFTSAIVVPLTVNGQAKGTITFVTSSSKRRYTEQDFHLAQQLTDRAAVAIENSLLYEEVKKEKERINELVSNVPGVVWEVVKEEEGGKFKLSYVSDYAEKMSGYTADEWYSTSDYWEKVIHPEDLEKAIDESTLVFKSGESGVSRYRWVKKTGEVIWVEAQSNVIKDKAGNFVGLRGVTSDITERVEIENRKDEFISMASHELKTPLTSLKIYTKLLQDKVTKGKKDKTAIYYSNMYKQLERLNKLVNELLNVSLIQTDKFEIKKSNFSLSQLVKAIVESTKPNAREKEIVLMGDIKKKVCGDPEYIEQVVNNLLANALKYAPKGDKIIVGLKSRNKDALVCVEDHGFGIDKCYHDKVFERFFRVYDKNDKTYPGLGMGLYISKQIIQRHGGDMWLESEKGKGSKFFFSIPFTDEK